MTSSANNTPTTSSLSGHTTRKSLSSRLGSLFGSKISHVTDFNIELNNSFKQYSTDEPVRGTVVLNVAKPLGVTHVTIRLEGTLQVFKNNAKPKPAVRPNGGVRTSTGRGKRWVSEYYGDGYASLFKEEIVLCGEGRLDPKLYHFRFEVDFPPGLDLPPSIVFERGTISYTLTATITRPQSINPTITCETNVHYRGNIDIAALPEAKLHQIILEPLERVARSRKRPSLPRLASSHSARKSSQPSGVLQADTLGRTITPMDSVGMPATFRTHSPSAESSVSQLSSPQNVSDVFSEQASTDRSSPRVSSQSDADNLTARCITATVQLERSGCLPGDVVPLQISIHHTKVIRSVHGVIITLFRQARVDMHPNLPLASDDHQGQKKYEDYYPRSRTGLGGLSLTAAGSSQMWRKDLSQTFAPIYIDPATMSTTFKIGVRVPDDALPSILITPGDMITFNYYVEVIIDLHGKLTQLDRVFPTLNMTGHPGGFTNGQGAVVADEDQHAVTSWGPNCVDTSGIKRDRNVVYQLCELIIGTKNSERSRSKRPEQLGDDQSSQDTGAPVPRTLNGSGSTNALTSPGAQAEEQHLQQGAYFNGYDEEYPEGYEDQYYEGYNPETGYGYGYDENGYDYDPNYYHETNYWSEDVIAPPEPDGEEVSEKERLRRFEMHLLPSQPPEDEDTWAGATEHTPTAPYILEENGFSSPGAFQAALHQQRQQGRTYTNGFASSIQPMASSSTSQQWEYLSASQARTRNTQPLAETPINSHPNDDKQELERLRLAAQVSAPDYSDDEEVESSSLTPPQPGLARPSAPTISDDEQRTWVGRRHLNNGPNAFAGETENLPRYVR